MANNPNNPVIDLTIDDEDIINDNHKDYQASATFVFRGKAVAAFNAANGRLGGPTRTALSPLQPQSRSQSRSRGSYPSSRPQLATLNPHHHHDGENDGRPLKRLKTNEGKGGAGLEKGKGKGIASGSISRESLMKCLQLQVIPHLDGALGGLPEGQYNTEELGKAVIGKVTDKDFEDHFRRGNGRLAYEVELRVVSRIQDLVRNLIKDPKYRVPRLTLNGKIIPSIEDAVPQRGSVNGFSEEHMELDGEENDGLEYDHDELEPERRSTPTPPPRPSKKKPPITPQRLQTRKKASQWQSGKVFESKREGTTSTGGNAWFQLSSRPYLKALDRHRLIAGTSDVRRPIRIRVEELRQPSAIHVDFSEVEARYLGYVARVLYGREALRQRDYLRDLRHLLKKDRDRTIRNGIIEAVKQRFHGYREPPTSLLTRSDVDVANYLDDLLVRRINDQPKTFRLERDDDDGQGAVSHANVVPSTLLAREIGGNRILSTRRYHNFTTALKSNREDSLEVKIEWTGCAGDITTISWLSNTHFVCGTTTHSDSHNQQYNKPGNLLLGSVTTKTLRAYPDHRIVRPIVTQGDNALDSMRESQEPWLFTSVVSSDYEPTNDLAFTSSFDKTVKAWKLEGDAMKAVGTWDHEGRVNFVVASKDPQGMVATAADVPTNAVRVYQVNPSDVSASRYDSYSCTKVHDEDYVPSEKWAYFPAAIRWGLAPQATHLLLIGYSPRSLYGEDHEIPEDKLNTGELCLWDTHTKMQVKVNSAATQNVFEVAWHPFRPLFIAATSASGLELEGNINTQIRIFDRTENDAYVSYTAIKKLDCAALDINEISIRPNSMMYCYVTASCTDGNVYVWDSAWDDLPMCILRHGEPVEELLGEREQEDVGVKFTAWGTTADRLYTGSSDGVVKVWNVRHGRRGVLVKDLIEASGPIICGAFSPDGTKLAIGDGTGRVYVMSLEDEDGEEGSQNQLQNRRTAVPTAAVSSGFLQSSAFLRLPSSINNNRAQQSQAIRRPRPFVPHPEVPPPPGSSTETPSTEVGRERAAQFLRSGQLVLHPDRGVGAIQGPRYADTGLYRAEAHLHGDPRNPLLGGFEAQQQENTKYAPRLRLARQAPDAVLCKDEDESYAIYTRHAQNTLLDPTLNTSQIQPATREALRAEGVEFEPLLPVDYGFSYEDEYSTDSDSSGDEEKDGDEVYDFDVEDSA